jgi:precorrin-3B synthase
MATGDGLLARFAPRDCIAFGAFIAICMAARRHGNGTIEITARGSLQVRGLSSDSAAHFATDIAALEIAASEGVPVIVDPLADDPHTLIDTADLAARLRRAIADARLVLAPKVCVIIDGGGRLHLDALAADVRLRAIGPSAAPRLYVAVGGTAASAAPLGSIAPQAAVQAVVSSLGVIAARGRRARAVDVLHSDGVDAFRSVLDRGIEPGPRPLPRLPTDPVGQHPLDDGSTALGIALPFGHAHADALAELMRAALGLGLRSVRPAPGRTLLLIGASAAATHPLAVAAEQLGFIVRADDPRRRIIACPGKPACASGLIASRAIAAELARHVSPRGDAIHVSGCSKGCAHPGAAALTVIGTAHGCGIVQHGSAAATPRHLVDTADLIGEIVRIIDTGETVDA